MVGFVDEEDGIFWMSFEDWSMYFVDLVVCSYNDDHVFSSIKMDLQLNGQPGRLTEYDFLIKFTISKQGDYTLGWHMTELDPSHFKAATLTVAKLLANNGVQVIQQKAGNGTDRDQYVKC